MSAVKEKSQLSAMYLVWLDAFLKFKVIEVSSKITLALKMITCINYF